MSGADVFEPEEVNLFEKFLFKFLRKLFTAPNQEDPIELKKKIIHKSLSSTSTDFWGHPIYFIPSLLIHHYFFLFLK